MYATLITASWEDVDLFDKILIGIEIAGIQCILQNYLIYILDK